MKKTTTLDILEKVMESKAFGIIALCLTPILVAIISLITKDWTWLIITIVVVIILLVTTYMLSALTSKVTKNVVTDLVKTDGILDQYLQKQLTAMAHEVHECGMCINKVQKDCRKSIEQFFLKQYNEIKFFSINEILEIEETVQRGEIWVITDSLGTEIDNEKVRATIVKNLRNGTVYKYFYSQNDKAKDAKRRLKTIFKDEYQITTIDTQIFFQEVNSRYDALLKLSQDIVFLNPTSKNRRAFTCIYVNDTFEIAFYRELDSEEISYLSGMLESEDFR